VRKISPPLGFDPRTIQPVVAIPTERPGPLFSYLQFENVVNTTAGTDSVTFKWKIYIAPRTTGVVKSVNRMGHGVWLCATQKQGNFETLHNMTGWAEHVARMRKSTGTYRDLVGMPKGERALGKPRDKWGDNIAMDHKEVGWEYGLD
jgi:hypothetical protein